MVTDPALILADEPTGALDSKSAKLLLDRFEVLNRQREATILMVTHDAFTASYCHRILFLQDGAVLTHLSGGTGAAGRFFPADHRRGDPAGRVTRAMFSELAWKNVRRSVRDYGVWFLTIVFGVCLFYTFNALENQTVLRFLAQNPKTNIVESIQSLIGMLSVFVWRCWPF